MKNKIKFKKFLSKIFLISIIFLIISSTIKVYEYKSYTDNFNLKLSAIIEKVIEEYPNISENEIIDIINNQNNSSNILKKYNIDIKKDSIILKNNHLFYTFIIINLIFTSISIIILVILFIQFNKNKDKDIKEITKYIEEINKKNYKLNIDDISEDELSILKNEIYKTTIMLKEQAENSKKDKIDLKKSLSNISHQLKTPLTSISIILDNILENPQMDERTKEDFIFDIKRELNNIRFLTETILKLSKLDTNTVTFINKQINISAIINESIKKVSCISDLKNISFRLSIEKDPLINIDLNWQIEAISNILKNCLEYSSPNSYIDIAISSNKIYSTITIKDYGVGIKKEELPHIFERFYTCTNSNKDSIGIGLSLAKSIIESSNGKILVTSTLNKGTTFTIKYYK